MNMAAAIAAMLPAASSSAISIGSTGLAFEPVWTAVAAGLGMGALGQYQAGQAAAAQAEGQAAMAEYNAKLQEREARMLEQQAAFRQRRQAREAQRHMSSLRAGLAASGAVPTEGAPLLIQSEQAAESELENLLIGYERQVGAQRATSQAQLDRLQASIYRKRAGTSRTAGIMGAGTTLLTGFGEYGLMRQGY